MNVLLNIFYLLHNVDFFSKFSYQSNALFWLVVEIKEKNSILDRDLNPGL